MTDKSISPLCQRMIKDTTARYTLVAGNILRSVKCPLEHLTPDKLPPA